MGGRLSEAVKALRKIADERGRQLTMQYGHLGGEGFPAQHVRDGWLDAVAEFAEAVQVSLAALKDNDHAADS